MSPQVKKYSLIIFLFIILFIRYTENWMSRDFLLSGSILSNNIFDAYADSFVYGSVMLSDEHDVLEYGGFQCRPTIPPVEADGDELRQFQTRYSYYKYNLNKPLPTQYGMDCYLSQVGGQAIFYSLINKVLNSFGLIYNGNIKIAILQGINVGLSIVVLFSFIQWSRREFSHWSAWFVYVGIFFNMALTLLAKVLFHPLFAYYLTFVVLLWFFYKNQVEKPNAFKLFVVTATSYFTTLFFIGFEYNSSVFLMNFLPFIYYFFKTHASLSRLHLLLFVKKASAILLGSLFALGLYFAVYVKQYETFISKHVSAEAYEQSLGLAYVNIGEKAIEGKEVSVSDAFKQLKMRFTNRTEVVTDKGSAWNMVRLYFLEALRLLALQRVPNGLFVLLAVWLMWRLVRMRGTMDEADRAKTLALVVVLGVSFVTSLSYLFVFRQHAMLHNYIDGFTLSLPFYLMLYVAMGHYAFLGRDTDSKKE